jgi:Halocarboxylic acid dehydrogenase DehI
MALTRLYEEVELSPELRRLFADVRQSFDFPFVPSIFKVLAAKPDYLKAMWSDLAPVARSKEFATASKALLEFVRTVAIRGGWQFSDQERLLAAQKFSQNDVEIMGEVVATFMRVTTRMALFARLIQRGYSGGQPGRISNGKQASALSTLISLHIPSERAAGLRTWLIYSDIKRTIGVKTVPSLFRVLSPWPAYMASVWVDTKRLLNDRAVQSARDDLAKRTVGLLTGLPVRDHRNLVRNLSAAEWREIEEMVDGFARTLPQLALTTAVWQRSYPEYTGRFLAA